MEARCEKTLETLHRDLHDLCQPLTALQCRLELGRMIGSCDSLREAVEGALDETERVFAIVAHIRTWLREFESRE